MGYAELKGRDLVCTADWSREELDIVLQTAKQIKRMYYSGVPYEALKGKTLFMMFFNDSTRTRNSFEAAMTQLGGHAHYIRPSEMRLTLDPVPTGKGESIKDTAKVLSRMGHAIGIRLLVDPVSRVGEATEILYEFAKHADVPVINFMTDYWHPCQSITDVMTLQEKFGPDLRGQKITVQWAYSPWARDWGSISATTIMYTRYGMDVTLAHPEGYGLFDQAIELNHRFAKESGGSFRVTNDLDQGLEGADVVFPRNWITMKRYEIGKAAEIEKAGQYKDWKFTKERREQLTNNAKLLHVMPIDRGNEADNELVDDPDCSLLYDQAENRLHSQKAILALTMGGRI